MTEARLVSIPQEARGAKPRGIIDGRTDVSCVWERVCGWLSEKVYNLPVIFRMIFFNVLR